ncbi:MAG: bifunctional serine/threonine-protein kinase/formylglycine-generating enzyme family protein [Pseudomonadota bacterium]|nr:bifunctional serine/threonine-protein kinase/formylglycine-generating enzyme family protein [Pseudomonadota bacterium]
MIDPVLEARLLELAEREGWARVSAWMESRLGTAQGYDAAAPRASADPTMLADLGGTDAPEAPDLTDPGDPRSSIPPRYELLVQLGRGGMGEVWRVRDRVLRRTLALKLILGRWSGHAEALARFREEASLTAGLQHPGIVPVHDLGWSGDGRWWYTMEEVRGRRLTELLAELREGRSEWTLHRHVDVFHRACEAVAYAHAHGVIHRDVKPDNILVGPHGEVRVVDWGLAKVVGTPDAEWRGEGSDEPTNPRHTTAGAVLGTRAYMAPEQARGDAEIGPPCDVYALGVILGELLGGAEDAPVELVDLRQRAIAPDAGSRPPNAGAVAEELRAWLDGARQRKRALDIVAQAQALLPEIPRLRADAVSRREAASAARALVKPWEPVAAKLGAWALEDAADALEREAERQELRVVQLLQGAFLHRPDLPEAHSALADWYRARHAEAEAARDVRGAARVEQSLRHHDRAGRHAAWLAGDGRLTLASDPPATASLLRYEAHERRLVAVPLQDLGETPLDVRLPMGSYLVVLRAPGHADVRYPVSIGRQEHWDGVAPGAADPVAIRLPCLGELGVDDVWLPPGPAWTGGDADANASLPWRRLWFPGMIARRFPVTNREYIEFLDDLVATGRVDEALRHAPRERAAKVEDEGALLYGRDAAGRFLLQPDADGDSWDLDWPIMHVDWYGARAYSQWLASRTGQAWRLPGDLERERMARGADGRLFPWGNHLDPTWCHMQDSHAGRPLPAVVDSCPIDESPHGVRGLGGNVREYCLDLFRPEGPDVSDGRAPPPVDPGDDPARRVCRGGDWYGQARLARAANRSSDWPQLRVSILGFRVVRDA